MNKYLRFITDREFRFSVLAAKGFYKRLTDEAFLRKKYTLTFHRSLNLESPKNFNEKNNWRKLHERRPIYTSMVDKYKVKSVVKDRCGGGYTIPLLGVWDCPEEIKFESLPDKFVLKVNHAGGIIVCRDKNVFDVDAAIKELKREQTRDYSAHCREWPYRNVERKIICEQYMGENLTDYKNYCFNGKLQYTFVWKNESRTDGRKPMAYFCGAYDRKWIKTDLEVGYPSKASDEEKRPVCYEEMVKVAEKLAADIPFVRVDCYIINNQPYVGEMTFFPWGGFMRFKDESWNIRLGEMMQLPTKPLQK